MRGTADDCLRSTLQSRDGVGVLAHEQAWAPTAGPQLTSSSCNAAVGGAGDSARMEGPALGSVFKASWSAGEKGKMRWAGDSLGVAWPARVFSAGNSIASCPCSTVRQQGEYQGQQRCCPRRLLAEMTDHPQLPACLPRRQHGRRRTEGWALRRVSCHPQQLLEGHLAVVITS